jgi:hypothetical protein
MSVLAGRTIKSKILEQSSGEFARLKELCEGGEQPDGRKGAR